MSLRWVARLLAPPSCIVCGQEGALICPGCSTTQVPPRTPTCFWCGAVSAGGRTCTLCRSLIALEGLVVASNYEGPAKELVHALKYRRQRDAVGVMAGMLTPLLGPVPVDMVTSVPIATNRLRQRGYNQSELIARAAARHLALPYRPLLRRVRNTQQVGKTRPQRLQQVSGLFVARSVPPARILVIDDVLTTGATLNACAIALQAAGAQEVWGAVAARD